MWQFFLPFYEKNFKNPKNGTELVRMRTGKNRRTGRDTWKYLLLSLVKEMHFY